MIVINKVKYESYYEFCKAYNISYAEFINYRRNNKGITELELIGHFVSKVAVCLKTGEYAVIER